jgi:hypothetical protein
MRFLKQESVANPKTVFDNVADPVALSHSVINTSSRVQFKRYTHMRLSQIANSCPREWVIGNLSQASFRDEAPFPSLVQMDFGSAAHFMLQNSPHYFPNILGYWKCLACGNTRRFGVRPQEPCEFCGSLPAATVYKEYMFRIDEPFRVVGKVDLILDFESVFRFGDIKTKPTPEKASPNVAEVSQVASYMYFSQFDKSKEALPIEIDRSRGYLVYFSKTFHFQQTAKTFPVDPTEGVLEPIIAKARAFTDGVRNGVLPEVLLICSNSNWQHRTPKACPMSNSCKSYSDRGIYKI